MLESITSSQFALGFAMLVHFTGRTEVLSKKGQNSTKKTVFSLGSELYLPGFVFPLNLIYRC